MQSDELESDQRLSRITTHWTGVIQAHHGTTTSAEGARANLLQCYAGAVYRYLLGAVRDPETAEDLSQEFMVRFLRGDFRRANPERGRFRDYLKTALINLVNDHYRKLKDRPLAFEAGLPEPAASLNESGEDFRGIWREEVLERTWEALRDSRANYYAVLRLRVDNPEMPAREIAERLTAELGKPTSGDTVRKTLERARVKFADLLVQEVEASMDSPDHAMLKAELKELDLLPYCRSAMQRRIE